MKRIICCIAFALLFSGCATAPAPTVGEHTLKGCAEAGDESGCFIQAALVCPPQTHHYKLLGRRQEAHYENIGPRQSERTAWTIDCIEGPGANIVPPLTAAADRGEAEQAYRHTREQITPPTMRNN